MTKIDNFYEFIIEFYLIYSYTTVHVYSCDSEDIGIQSVREIIIKSTEKLTLRY